MSGERCVEAGWTRKRGYPPVAKGLGWDEEVEWVVLKERNEG